MDKVFARQIGHAVGHLATEGEELSGEGGRDGDRGAGGGRRGGAGTVSLR